MKRIKSFDLFEEKVKDLDKWLTDKTGLDKDERAKWRADINKLMDKAKAEKDEKKAKEKKAEVMRVFQSFNYWKENYQNKK